ncbi:MAG: hypothetical protein ACYDG5_01355 [Dehalococcoidales bacterium]
MALYEDVVTIAKSYIGPAAQQFLDRQLATHLNVKSADLAAANLAELSKWCFTSGRLIIDEKQATEFSDKVKALAK